MEEIDSKFKLKRYCFIGRLEPVYLRLRDSIKVPALYDELNKVISKLKSDAFLSCMTEVIRHGDKLPRIDETIFAYATYLASSDVDLTERAIVRREFPILFRTDREMFLFCKYSRGIQKHLNRKGFSRTTKRAIVSWYQLRTPDELREMWFSNRGLNGFTHKDLIRMCHITDDTVGDKMVSKIFFSTCTELIQATDYPEGVLANEPVIRTHNNVKTLCTLRTIVKRNDASKLVKSLRLTYDQVPHRLLKLPSVAEVLLPQMSFLEIVQKWHVLRQYGHLEKSRLMRLITSLTTREAQEKAQIHPTVFISRMDRMGIPVDAEGLRKISEKKNKSYRMSYFQQMLYNSFSLNHAAGLRTHITMTLQQNYKRKFLDKKTKGVTYFQAAVGLAFSYFKREKHTDVFTFTRDYVKIAQVPWEKKVEFSEAMEICDSFNFQRSSQRLVQPLMDALCRSHTYDLFIVIVPSAGRSNPRQCSEFLVKFVDKYRMTKNKRAKFVIVSLLKQKRSMTYSTLRNENILEICGLDKDTARLIDSFALNRFG